MILKTIGISRLRMGTDGEGIRTLVAAYGCPLRCKYCLNPHSWNGECTAKEWTVEKLYEKLKVDNLYFLATGGGVTFGGGEPLLYAEFIREFAEYTEHKWNIAMETSLNVPQSALEEVIGCVDRFIVDIKSVDEEIYSAYTGGDNGQVLENLEFLLGKVPQVRLTVRVPYIPDYTDDEAVVRTVERLELLGVEDVEVFTYSR